jgi:outer membrane protein OmpA-like peptidoglycan-associated protein
VLIENNDTFVLKNLIFDLNKSAIRPQAETELDKLAKIMTDKPSMKILLEGHTAIGNARKNRVLSEKRVKSTKEYLVKQGVVRSNITTKGWGQQKPLVSTRDVEKGKINRRVEIQILSR